MPTTPLSTNSTINALLSTYQWGTQNGQSSAITYSFPTINSVWSANYGEEITAGWSVLNATQQAFFNSALSAWAEIANISFTQVADNQNTVGDIRVAFSNAVTQKGYDGWGYYPTSVSLPQAGDVWLSPDNTDYSLDTQNYTILLHELGHALGLKHPFEAEGGNNAVLTGAEDSTQFTLMSYTEYQGAGFVYHLTDPTHYIYYPEQPATPMLYDIAAIQFLYGANMSTRTGNDTYTFNNSQAELKTIWDAGGVDTFDLSNQTLNQTINLNAGQFSSIGVKQTTYNGPLSTATANIAIAYNVSIENAIGGAGNDVITGSAISNVINGGAGNDRVYAGSGNDRVNGDADNDVISGGNGNDTLTGGLGNDRLDGSAGKDKLDGGAGNDTYVVDSNADIVTELASAGTDTVQSTISLTLGANVEKLTLLGSLANKGTGNELANTLTGNNANNSLDGGLGNDTLIGAAGSDTLTGGTDKDVFLFNSTVGIDTITDYSVTFDTIRLENAVFTSLTSTGVLAADQFKFGSLANDSNDYLLYNKTDGALYYDADGSGAIASTQIAILGTNLALANTEFLVV